ncbi:MULTISPECIES: Uma2 family endonuclease [Moorena]|uniref:Putative restriction endonuclease domain-containing protein n=1 Tax=Moorena producens 3L TaxID=489825 RepID=F4XUK8_9CYAN|nr:MULTISPECIES: Uma2 family endonuclease [Moorena]EGJ31833.1 hypothetical protein LYNGBM3L_33210 [Moorena producens 3L]
MVRYGLNYGNIIYFYQPNRLTHPTKTTWNIAKHSSANLIMQSPSITNSLDTFLQQPNIEASPAWEFIHGHPKQKPMPTLFHSRLQRNLVNAINNQTQAYEAIQELRCIIPPLSPVPDIVVVKSVRLRDQDGPLQGSPDWLIEIRSPDQSTLDLQNKILHFRCAFRIKN